MATITIRLSVLRENGTVIPDSFRIAPCPGCGERVVLNPGVRQLADQGVEFQCMECIGITLEDLRPYAHLLNSLPTPWDREFYAAQLRKN